MNAIKKLPASDGAKRANHLIDGANLRVFVGMRNAGAVLSTFGDGNAPGTLPL
jgi:hypothetical protein